MTVHRILFAALAALLVQASGAWAVGFIQADLNGDGVVELSEAERVFPDLKPVLFRKCDMNRDGVIERGEYPALESLYDTLYRYR
jgi:hypothetical protein